MEPRDDHRIEDSRRRLLEEGARSYVDAINALAAYRAEVQKICRTVLKKHLNDYTSALQVQDPFEDDEIRDVDKRSEDEDRWLLGVKIVRQKVVPTIRWWETWCCLSHGSGDDGVSTFIDEWFPTKQIAEDLYRRFRTLNRNVQYDGNDLWIGDDMKADQIHNLESRLESVVNEWLETWKRVGGMWRVFEE